MAKAVQSMLLLGVLAQLQRRFQ